MEAPFLLELLERSRKSGPAPLPEPLVSALGEVLLAWLVAEHAQTPQQLHRETFARLGCMSPEQARGRPIDVRSDLFAAGVLLFELACGKRPFDGITELVAGEVSTPLAANPKLSEPLAAVLARALALEPQARYATAAELRTALELAAPPAGADAVTEWATPWQPKAAPPPKPTKPRAGLRWVGATAFVIAPIAATLFLLRAQEQHQLDLEAGYAASLRPCEIVTDPPGAVLVIDGTLFSARAPTVARFEPGRDYVIELTGPAGQFAVRKVRDQKRIAFRLADGAVTESTLYGATPEPLPQQQQRQQQQQQQQQPAAATPTGPVPEPVKTPVPYDFERGPVEFTLGPEHQVGIPAQNCIDVSASRKTPYRTHTSHVFALFTKAKGNERLVTVEDWVPEPGQLCVFMVTDSSSTHLMLNRSLLRWDSTLSGVKKPLVYVDGTDRVLIRSFPPGRWRVRVTGGSGAYHPVLVTQGQNGIEISRVVDAYETLVDSPKSMWFTVPVLESEPDLRFAVNVEKVR